MTQSRFPGDYELVSSHRCYPSGRPIDLQPAPRAGRTGYDANGRMWVVLASPARKSIDLRTVTVHEYQHYLANVVVYYGRYEVDERTSSVVHHLEGALDPAWTGRRFVRRYAFDEDLLTLTFSESDHEVRTVYRRLPP
jgi:hypothetical protein